MSTKKLLIADSLANLSGEDLARFRFWLGDSYRVPQSKVEKKDYMELADVLVKQFTEDEAPVVTSNILRSILCNQDATNLGKSPPISFDNGPSAVSVQHFVDKHRSQLIERVTNIDPILDGLLNRRVLLDAPYEEIRNVTGKQNKMRMIYDIALKSGDRAKNVFMELLRQKEPYLVEDLLKDP
ncbi:apoptosis-associated speck-like protein containing a CARD [Stigmatopora argus]